MTNPAGAGNPAFGAVPDGVPFVVAGEPAVFAVFDVAQVEAVAAGFVVVCVFVVQAQGDAVVLEVCVGLGVVRQKAQVFRDICPQAEDVAVAALVGHVVISVNRFDFIAVIRVCSPIRDVARAVCIVLAQAALGVGEVDVQVLGHSAPDGGTVEAFFVAVTCRGQPEAAASELCAGDGHAELDAVRFVAEEDVLEAQAAPGTANAHPAAVFLPFDPDALHVAVVAGPGLLARIVFAAQVVDADFPRPVMAVVVVAVRFTLELDGPVVVDFEIAAQIHVEAVRLLIQGIGARVLVVVVLGAHEAVKLDAVDFFFIFLDVLRVLFDLLRILGDLLLEDIDFIGVFSVQFFQDRLVTEVAAAFLHGFGDDAGHFVARHRAAAFEGAVAHAFDDAFFGQVIQSFIGPMVFGDIGETVGRCRQSRARHAQAQGQQDGKAFLVEFHHKDLFSINYLPAWPLRCHRLCVPVPGWPDGPWRRCSRDSPESWAGR